MHTIALFHLKGGVGKTTSAVNLAYEIALQGKATVLWDMDPQASASWYLGVEDDRKNCKVVKLLKQKVTLGELRLYTPYDKLTVIPSDASMRNQDLFFGAPETSKKFLRKLVDMLDETQSAVIFDCAPSLSTTTDHIFNAVDILLIPLIPSPLSLRAYQQVIDYLHANKRWKKLKVYPFFTMVDKRRKLHCDLLENNQIPNLLSTYIPYASIVEQMGLRRSPLGAFAPSAPATVAYAELWKELKKKL